MHKHVLKAAQDTTRQGAETTKSGGLQVGKVFTDSRFGLSSPIFRFQPAGHIPGPKVNPFRAQRTPFRGHTGPNTGKRQPQTVPKLIVSINVDNGTFWGAQGRHRGPFLVALAPLGPAWGPNPGPAPGPATRGAWRGTLAAGTRAFRVPKAIACPPNTIPGSRGTIFFFDVGAPVAPGPVKGPEGLACCWLARRAGSTLVPNNSINRLKSYELQLGDPTPNPCAESLRWSAFGSAANRMTPDSSTSYKQFRTGLEASPPPPGAAVTWNFPMSFFFG